MSPRLFVKTSLTITISNKQFITLCDHRKALAYHALETRVAHYPSLSHLFLPPYLPLFPYTSKAQNDVRITMDGIILGVIHVLVSVIMSRVSLLSCFRSHCNIWIK